MNDEDNRLFINVFGRNIKFLLKNKGSLDVGSDGEPLKGIFDIPFLNVEIGEFEIGSSTPRLTCISTDVVDVKKHDVVIIDNIEYNVVLDPQPDGEGMSIVELGNKAQ